MDMKLGRNVVLDKIRQLKKIDLIACSYKRTCISFFRVVGRLEGKYLLK